VRLELKRAILRSWNRRGSLFGGPYHILSCYPDAAILEAKGRLEVQPCDCASQGECALKPVIGRRRRDLASIRNAIKKEASRPEVAKRIKVPRQLEKHFSSLMGSKECRVFGDAYFVLFCPSNAVILTTNLRDIDPMAIALGLMARRP
jgi:hypothetical protein